jgi:predicted phage terminase large subunit-like protein
MHADPRFSLIRFTPLKAGARSLSIGRQRDAVMKFASSEARNRAAFATSQAVPILRRSGTRASQAAATSARRSFQGEQFPTRSDKSTPRAINPRRMALQGLYVPERAPWYANFRAELLSFPAARHDDQVDAIGLVGQMLDQMERQ